MNEELEDIKALAAWTKQSSTATITIGVWRLCDYIAKLEERIGDLEAHRDNISGWVMNQEERNAAIDLMQLGAIRRREDEQ